MEIWHHHNVEKRITQALLLPPPQKNSGLNKWRDLTILFLIISFACSVKFVCNFLRCCLQVSISFQVFIVIDNFVSPRGYRYRDWLVTVTVATKARPQCLHIVVFVLSSSGIYEVDFFSGLVSRMERSRTDGGPNIILRCSSGVISGLVAQGAGWQIRSLPLTSRPNSPHPRRTGFLSLCAE